MAGGEAFDLDEHMARMIEASERAMGFAPARGWEEGELEQVRAVVVCPRGKTSRERDGKLSVSLLRVC